MDEARQLRPAVFFDRDGTLIEDRGHLGDPADVEFLPRTIEALRRLQNGFLLFIVTNQSGIGEGLLSLEDALSPALGLEPSARVRITWPSHHIFQPQCKDSLSCYV